MTSVPLQLDHVRTAEQKGAHVIIEVTVEAQNVGVAQVRLDLYLAAQLVLHLVLLQLRLVQRLRMHAWALSFCAASCAIDGCALCGLHAGMASGKSNVALAGILLRLM